MNFFNIKPTPSFLLAERERERESLSSLKIFGGKEQAFSYLPFRGGMRRGALGAILGALVLLLVAILVACPTGSAPTYGYVCTNGTASSLRDATADGLSRCVSCDHPLFFALEGSSDAIGTTCRTVAEVGGAVRIGMVMQFGVGENFPVGLAAIGNTLYMVGRSNAALHTLNIDPTDGTDDGMAIQVGSVAAGFGVGENNPGGLAAIDTTLYMVGANTDVLYTLNIDPDDGTGDGMAIQVGSVAAGFGVGENFPVGLAAIGNTLYMVGRSNAALHTLNIDPDDGTDDGMAIQVGSLSAGFGVGEGAPTGLAAIASTLYMVGTTNDVLYTLNIDPAGMIDDGMAIQVGSVAAGFGVTESLPAGLAAIDSALYMVGQAHDALYVLRYQ